MALFVSLLLAASAAHPLNAGLPAPSETIDRSTPLATVHGFLNAAHASRYPLAAHYLNLDHLQPEQQPVLGPKLARRLRFVIDRKLFVDFSELGREPNGDPGSPHRDQLGIIPLGHTNQPIRVSRVDDGAGSQVWVFSPETVKSIDKLYDAYGPPLGDDIPDFFFRHSILSLELWQWIGLILIVFAATVIAWLFERVLLAGLTRTIHLAAPKWGDSLVRAGRGPVRIPIWAAVVYTQTPHLLLPVSWQHTIEMLCRSGVIAAIAWGLLRLIATGASAVQVTMGERHGDPERAVGLRTQVALMRRILTAGIYLVAASLLLMQFQVVRHVGVSLLASAGLAGLVVGVAAQKSLSTLLAGIQLTVTQPIRFGDAVVVEGEFGTVEEITLTYVIIRAWDERRLIVPMSYFLEKPFQNWSKGENELLATVTLVVSRDADVETLRSEVRRVLESEAKALWNGSFPNVIVTEGANGSLVVRVLVAAVSADANWQLRKLLQERLLQVVQAHPQWLPASPLKAAKVS